MLAARWKVLVEEASIHVLVLGGGPGSRGVLEPVPQCPELTRGAASYRVVRENGL